MLLIEAFDAMRGNCLMSALAMCHARDPKQLLFPTNKNMRMDFLILMRTHMEGGSVELEPSSSEPLSMSSSSDVNDSLPLVARLGKLLFRKMLVGVNDGRFFLGGFHCLDKQGNIILQDAIEYRSTGSSSPSPVDQRCLGMILIPSHCRTSCHVDCAIDEQLSLLSLDK